jgi:hypothetical protein
VAGIRIKHTLPRLANKTLTLVDGNRPYPVPWECPVCHQVHLFKTYHLQLDDVASTIVSLEIVERLKQLVDTGGFIIGEEIAKPPAQRVVLGGAVSPYREIVAHPTLIEPR